jgi:hypothetical protein
MPCANPEVSCSHAEEAAGLAVKQMFAILGVNIDEPKEVEEFRENLRFGASMRRASDRGLLGVVGLIFAGMAAATWVGITAIISKAGGH